MRFFLITKTPAPATSSEQAISGPTPAAGATQGPVPSGQSNLTEPSTVGPSQFPQDPQPNVGAPLDPVQSTLNPVRGPLKVIPDLPTVPSAVFMLEFERRFKNLEKSFKGKWRMSAVHRKALRSFNSRQLKICATTVKQEMLTLGFSYCCLA